MSDSVDGSSPEPQVLDVEQAVREMSPEAKQELAASVVESLETAEQQRAAAESVLGALASEAKQGLAATVTQSLDTAEQQRAAAESVLGALPSEAKEGLAASVVQSLDTAEQQRAAAEGVLGALPAEQQQQVAESVLGLEPPRDAATRARLWYLIVGTMALSIFAFGVMAFVLIYQGKAAEAPLALATTALGGIVGLVVTSPTSTRSR